MTIWDDIYNRKPKRRTISASNNPALLGGVKAKNNGRYNGNGRNWETPPEIFLPLHGEFNKMKTPEGYEKDAICKYLDEGVPIVWYFKTFTGGYGNSGNPDIVGVHKFKGFFSIEVKREGKDPTALQALRMQKIRDAGGKTFWGTADKVIPEFERWVS